MANIDLGTAPDPIVFMNAVLVDGMTPEQARAAAGGATFTRELTGKKCLYLRCPTGTLQCRTPTGQEQMRRMIAGGVAEYYKDEQQDEAADTAARDAAEQATAQLRTERRKAPKPTPDTGNAWAEDKSSPEPAQEKEPETGGGWNDDDGA